MKIKAFDLKTVEVIIEAYLECAAWAGLPGDSGRKAQFSKSAKRQTRADVEAFLRLIIGEGLTDQIPDWYTNEQLGHDFWLTRNRHGTGFWDRGLGKLGEDLTKLAHTCGECWVALTPNKLWITMFR